VEDGRDCGGGSPCEDAVCTDELEKGEILIINQSKIW